MKVFYSFIKIFLFLIYGKVILLYSTFPKSKIIKYLSSEMYTNSPLLVIILIGLKENKVYGILNSTIKVLVVISNNDK